MPEDVEPEIRIKPCPFCKGSGKLTLGKVTKECKICHGNGSIVI